MTLAGASGAPIIGFNVRPNAKAREIAERQKVAFKYYDVIYDLTDEIRAGMAGERLYLQATALGLSSCGVGAFYDDEAAALAEQVRADARQAQIRKIADTLSTLCAHVTRTSVRDPSADWTRTHALDPPSRT